MENIKGTKAMSERTADIVKAMDDYQKNPDSSTNRNAVSNIFGDTAPAVYEESFLDKPNTIYEFLLSNSDHTDKVVLITLSVLSEEFPENFPEPEKGIEPLFSEDTYLQYFKDIEARIKDTIAFKDTDEIVYDIHPDIGKPILDKWLEDIRVFIVTAGEVNRFYNTDYYPDITDIEAQTITNSIKDLDIDYPANIIYKKLEAGNGITGFELPKSDDESLGDKIKDELDELLPDLPDIDLPDAGDILPDLDISGIVNEIIDSLKEGFEEFKQKYRMFSIIMIVILSVVGLAILGIVIFVIYNNYKQAQQLQSMAFQLAQNPAVVEGVTRGVGAYATGGTSEIMPMVSQVARNPEITGLVQ